MKAKLIKVDNGWVLMIDNIMYATDNDKLSLKNCQAIERGYDLDELAEKEYPIFNLGLSSTTSLHTLHQESFKAGFQKALELMSDKKFSEEDMRNAYLEGANQALDFNPDSVIDENKYIQLLQQNEWQVEIQIDTVLSFEANEENAKVNPNFGKPLLDKDGCLILKTFKSE